MSHFPLLDLRDAWRDVFTMLEDVDYRCDLLDEGSDHTDSDYAVVRAKVRAARAALGMLPDSILAGIADEEAQLQEDEDRADAASY